MKKLHLGCGKRYIPGFIHVDALKFDHIDYVTKVENLPMFNSNSIDLIYACHVLEHFMRSNVNDVLMEWFRVLKHNGILRLSVPDFEAIIKVYEKYKDLSKIIGPLYGGQNNIYNIHYNCFDFKTLKLNLKKVGFKKILKYDRWKTDHAEYDDFSAAYIPHMKRDGILISLNIEAMK